MLALDIAQPPRHTPHPSSHHQSATLAPKLIQSSPLPLFQIGAGAGEASLLRVQAMDTVIGLCPGNRVQWSLLTETWPVEIRAWQGIMDETVLWPEILRRVGITAEACL